MVYDRYKNLKVLYGKYIENQLKSEMSINYDEINRMINNNEIELNKEEESIMNDYMKMKENESIKEIKRMKEMNEEMKRMKEDLQKRLEEEKEVRRRENEKMNEKMNSLKDKMMKYSENPLNNEIESYINSIETMKPIQSKSDTINILSKLSTYMNRIDLYINDTENKKIEIINQINELKIDYLKLLKENEKEPKDEEILKAVDEMDNISNKFNLRYYEEMKNDLLKRIDEIKDKHKREEETKERLKEELDKEMYRFYDIIVIVKYVKHLKKLIELSISQISKILR